jgi:5-methylcytosine-specific restriction endonuclease McrA
MKTPKDIKVGEMIGTVLITKKQTESYYSKTSTMFYGICQNCNAERKITSSHAGVILKGRGGGCHCSRRRTETDPEYKWRYGSYSQAAHKRSLAFNISYELFLEITQKNCYYCNAEPEMRPTHSKRWDFTFPMSGIDRVDSSRGYEEDNVVPCCSHCNQAKWDYTTEEFLSWIKRVYEYQFQEVVSA